MKRFRDGTPDVFDVTKTGMIGYWQHILEGYDLDYYKNKKNLVGKIEYMTPRQYYNECVPILREMNDNPNITSSSLVRSRNYDPSYIKKLEEVITVKHKKFPICVLDKSLHPGQEGLHRMLAVANLYGWDTYEFPVLVIENYIKIEPKKVLANIVNKAKMKTFKNWHELQKYLVEELNDSIFYHDYSVKYDYEPDGIVTVYGNYEDKDYILEEDINQFTFTGDIINI